MSVGSIGTSSVATVAYDAARLPGDQKADEAAGGPTIADHVAAADEQEPIRSQSSTLGTLVDTYL